MMLDWPGYHLLVLVLVDTSVHGSLNSSQALQRMYCGLRQLVLRVLVRVLLPSANGTSGAGGHEIVLVLLGQRGPAGCRGHIPR